MKKHFHLILGVVLIILLPTSYAMYKVIKWKMYIWLPSYAENLVGRTEINTDPVTHIMFLFVDHYEPGGGQAGVEKNREWLANYRALADRHRDSYGRKPQHSWFYAYDHGNDGVMPDLSQVVRDGYGEVEFHWHHSNDNNESFRRKLAEGIKWFNRYGALIDNKGRVSFGFIHGNWSLDNSRGNKYCGVTRELEVLKQSGCYADFTFPSFGQISQPPYPNTIYYASEDDSSMSYVRGEKVRVGRTSNSDLMIFQGPLTLTDYGAVESDPNPNRVDIDSWIEAKIHVTGRPNWIFVKVFTHGVQSRKVIFSPVVDDMFYYMEQKYGKGRYRLHYVTAREAYNIVRAAEDGKNGNPNDYIDYIISQPVNKMAKK